jgi:uncharacterized membrane protein YhaH (DUF805 family)
LVRATKEEFERLKLGGPNIEAARSENAMASIFSGFSGECNRRTWWLGFAIMPLSYAVTSGLAVGAIALGLLRFPTPFWLESALFSPAILLSIWVIGGVTTRRIRNLRANLWLSWILILASFIIDIYIIKIGYLNLLADSTRQCIEI